MSGRVRRGTGMLDVGLVEMGVEGDEFGRKVADVDRTRVYAVWGVDGEEGKKEVGNELGGGRELGENPELEAPRPCDESNPSCARGGDNCSCATS